MSNINLFQCVAVPLAGGGRIEHHAIVALLFEVQITLVEANSVRRVMANRETDDRRMAFGAILVANCVGGGRILDE